MKKWIFDGLSFHNRFSEKYKGDYIILGIALNWSSFNLKRIVFGVFGLELSVWFKLKSEED